MDWGDAFISKRVLAVARGDAGSTRFEMNPEGTSRMRRMPVLRLLAVVRGAEPATTRRRAWACNAYGSFALPNQLLTGPS
jgi:hypothetical protein